jgi:hypothetical protein
VGRDAFRARVAEIEAAIAGLQRAAERTSPDFVASRRLGYRRLVERVRSEIEGSTPTGAKVLVVSRGDRELVRIDGRAAEHFPQGPDGGYAGHHPADGAEAIAELERLREQGAEYLVLPPTASWWLDHYADFAKHLRTRHMRLESGECEIYRLNTIRR